MNSQQLNLRVQFRNALDSILDAHSDLTTARRAFEAAQERVDQVIDKLVPDETTQPTLDQVRTVMNARKISLIKLVRTATGNFAKTIDYPVDNGACMGLKDAKDLVEKWIDSGGAL